MAPLDFIHFNDLSPSDSFLLINYFDRIFNIREVQLYPYFSLFNNLGGNSDTFLELRDMKDIVYG
jgi:hypothetical protein